MVVPKRVLVGGSSVLDCQWQEENDKFYSVKWYQASNEFYRFTPSAPIQIQIFDPQTLKVDPMRSLGGRVLINNVTLEAAGPFHCEVSADSPTFHTASLHANLSVVDPPDNPPLIQGVRSQYLAGDWVDLTCTSEGSNPHPLLFFSVNDEPVPEDWLDTQIDQTNYKGLSDSILRLRFPLLPSILKEEGYARVKCSSIIPDIYYEESIDVITTLPPFQASVQDGASNTSEGLQ
ncbi:hypothetical protein SK128_011705 [Halocaridina rubra]|uniref:Ig-like domain-containing protein n=1 Tax=Halocaridina rubra TaxID=373956 RepID=A0AAN8WSV6_HALRR